MEGQPAVWTTSFLFVLKHHCTIMNELEALLVRQHDEALSSSARDKKRTAADDLNIWAINNFFPNTLRYSMFATLTSNRIEFLSTSNHAILEFLRSCAEHLHSELVNVAVRDAYPDP